MYTVDADMLSFLYRAPPSILVTAMSVFSLVSLARRGLLEARGNHLRYSKFWDAASSRSNDVRVPSRAGMMFLYTPSLAAALASLPVKGGLVAASGAAGVRSHLVGLALCLHYLKRDLEVLFVHRYSGQMVLGSIIPIMLSYLSSTMTMIYAQYLSEGTPEPAIDLKYAGAVLFLVGTVGNFYHHCLLAGLSKKKGADKGYKIPRGGLFGLVACPHYLSEIVGFLGIAFMSQTLYAFALALGTAFYLMGRSYATRRWYASKFEGYPRDVKALIPYLF